MASKKPQGSDDRFVKVKKDPRFWEMPEKERKIKIDKRFQSMFHEERFKMKYTVDKRGRPVNHTSTEDMKRFYNLSDDEQSGEEEEGGKKKKRKKQLEKKKEKVGAKVDAAAGKDTDDSVKPVEEGKTLKPEDSDFRGAQTERGVRVFMEGEEEEDDDKEERQQPGMDEDEEDAAEVDVGDDSMSDASEDGDEDEPEAESDLEGESEDESGSESDDDSGPDLARGKGNVETSSDEDEEEEDDVEAILRREEEEIEHEWGELCKDAPRTEDVTKRLAVCNMDWDRMKAKDLLALFNSFKPKGGVVLSVKIYPSDYGKERVQIEQTQGPLELMAVPEDPEKDTEEEMIYREKMRDYQFKRLKYYYAVVECDSLETAAKIYEECDGFEYESSCAILDLRYIPDDMTFDDEPKDMATDVDLSVYTPKSFTSTASATSKVELTWDETDHERITAMNRKFNKDELLQMDFNAYLASSSEEEEEEEGEGEGLIQMNVQEKELQKAKEQEALLEEVRKNPVKGKKKSAEQISKYREMLKSIQDKNKKHQDKDMEMEITWVPGLKETTEQLVKKKLEGKDTLTPWEEFLEKKKDKKKLKTKNKQASESDLSDDELPPDVDLDDPFFAEELGSVDLKKKTKAKKKKEEERTPEEEEALVKRKAEMALLMDDEDDSKHKHFNYDKIVEDQNLSKNKKKRLLKKNTTQEEEDNFKVDVEDPRFQAMFTSHLYNLDPSHPGYKKTKATQSILEEKQRRREQSVHQVAPKSSESKKQEMGADKQEKTDSSCSAVLDPSKKAIDPALSMLVKSIKNKTEQFQARKKQKTT